MLNQIPDDLLTELTLWYLVQHSLSAFQKIQKHFPNLEGAFLLQNIEILKQLKLHPSHLQRFTEFHTVQGQQQYQQCLTDICQYSDFILTPTHINYPAQFKNLVDAPPILFGLGCVENLQQPQIAIVGSREPSPHGRQVAYDFAYYLSEKGFFICSGLAQGIDAAAHQGALPQQRTLAVVGTGLNDIYPRQHRALHAQILQENGTILSEFLPHTPPLQHHFPRRNRLVSGLSLGVLVAEAALKSGSLITAKIAAEQGKTVFAIPGHIYSEHHQGCHQLIREGAILVDHPEQIIEDLALATTWHMQQTTNITEKIKFPTSTSTSTSTSTKNITTPSLEHLVPTHLNATFQVLTAQAQSLDQLALQLNLSTSELTSQLMELELLGFCIQHAGQYQRCRSNI